MKKVFLLITLISLIALISLFTLSFFSSVVKKLASPIPTILPLPSELPTIKPQTNEIALNGKTYQFHFHKIENGETLELIPNFQEATFSAQIMKKNNCTFGVNGGFYKKEGGPLGLFFADQKLFGEKIQSTTFNGFLSSCHSCEGRNLNPLEISNSLPFDLSQFDFAFQSGPLIFLKNEAQPNFLDRDFSRRNLIARSTTNEFYLFTIFEKDNKFNGPRLEDLRPIFLSPDFTDSIPASAGTSFDLILNLDGGTASAFYDHGVQVEEFKPIGSFLCGKKL